MKLNSKTTLETGKKRTANAAPDAVPRRMSPSSSVSKLSASGKRTPVSDSPYIRLTMTHSKPHVKWGKPSESLPSQTGQNPGGEQDRGRAALIPRKSSYTDIFTEPSYRSASPKSSDPDKSSDPALSLNKTLTDRLRALGPHYDVKDRYLIFQDTFATVIGLEHSFGLILRRIKNGYEEVVAQYLRSDYDREMARVSKQMGEMQEFVEIQQQEKEKLLDTVAQMKKENERIRNKVGEQSLVVQSLENQLKDALETARKDFVPQTNVDLHSLLKDLQDEVSSLKSREKAFLSALKTAKQQNLSIDDLILSLSRHHRKSQSSSTPSTKLIVPKLNLPVAAQQPFGLLSPIRGEKEEQWGDHLSQSEVRESIASFCKDFEMLQQGRKEK